MSIIQDIQNKVLEEEQNRNHLLNAYKMFNFRPSKQLMALIEVLAYLDDKTPSEFVGEVFGQALYNFVRQSTDHEEPIRQAVTSCVNDGYSGFKENSAIGLLEKKGLIKISVPECDGSGPRLLSENFNESFFSEKNK